MPQSKNFKRCTVAALLLNCFFTAGVLAATDTGQWVRVHHRSDLSALESEGIRERLSDYGSFQWGRLTRRQIERLQQMDLSVTVEENPFELTLGGQSFDPLQMSQTAAARAADPEGDFYLLQFDGPIRKDWVRQLRATGVEVVQPLHPFSYVVWARSAPASAASTLPRVRWSGLMRADWKLAPAQRFSEAGLRQTMALASAHADPGRLTEELSAFGRVHAITPLNRHYRIVHMEVDRRDYPLIAELPAIYTVQYIPPETGPRGEMSNQSIVGGIDGSGDVVPGFATWLNNTGFDGSGVTVGVVDGRVRTTHQDLADRIEPCTGTNGSCGAAPNDDHGTHVAGAIAGTGATGALRDGFLRGQGVAPGAGIVSQIYGPFTDSSGPGAMVPDGMLQIYQDSAQSGALLTNNSWGPTGSPQGYDIPTQQIDFISRDADPDVAGHQPVLAVWSIMNGEGDDSGACAPSSLGSPDEAKNLFAVGSTALQSSGGSQVSNIFSVSANSGHGPACDGRRVPHIVAPGCYTDSTSSAGDTAHTFKCGTSMASPVVSGSVAVWAQKYISQRGTSPSPALAKAVFTAAAQNLEGETNADGNTMGHRPDRFQGYGRIDLERVMNHGVQVFMHDQETIFNSVGQDWSLALNAVDPAEPIRIMLAWTDAPGHGMGGDTPAWVNNLDLSVNAGGSTYFGNVIGVDGWSASGGTADGMNNLEGVFLSPIQHGGAVDITVTASDLAGDALNPYNPGDPSQDFALVCYNCQTYVVTNDPEAVEACIPESGTSTHDATTFIFETGGYTGTVNLTTAGEPNGVSSIVSPASVSPPGSSTWTLTIADTAPEGQYQLSIDGDDGSLQNSSPLDLALDSDLTGAPALSSPADGEVDTSLTPTLSWSAQSNADSYTLQLATDVGFTNIVTVQTLESTSWSPASELASATQYFWRVQGTNACGNGNFSSVHDFTTIPVPQADLSQADFSFELNPDDNANTTLTISNIGTGDLTWEIATDEPTVSALQRESHDPARDEVLDLADFSLPGGSTSSDSQPGGVTTSGPVVGFTFQGDVSGISVTGTYASDMAMTVTSPGSASISVGGYQTGNPDWEFQGSGSDDDGTYSSTHVGDPVFGSEGVDDEGTWQFDFEHTWDDEMSWTDVTVTLHKVAPPVCEAPLSAPGWLSVNPASGSVAAGTDEDVTVSVDASSLAEGEYIGYLCVSTNDPANALIGIEVQLIVKIGIFSDRFEAPPAP